MRVLPSGERNESQPLLVFPRYTPMQGLPLYMRMMRLTGLGNCTAGPATGRGGVKSLQKETWILVPIAWTEVGLPFPKVSTTVEPALGKVEETTEVGTEEGIALAAEGPACDPAAAAAGGFGFDLVANG